MCWLGSERAGCARCFVSEQHSSVAAGVLDRCRAVAALVLSSQRLVAGVLSRSWRSRGACARAVMRQDAKRVCKV